MPGFRALLRPFRRDKKADFSAGDVVATVQAAVGQILGTKAASDFNGGEIPWRPEMGSWIDILRHRKNDAALQELARVYVVDAISRWEPRARVRSVLVAPAEGSNAVRIRITYDIVMSDGKGIIAEGVEEMARV